MTWISLFAVVFIVWWVVLFATLPFSLRTQDDEGDITLGTTSSAPGGPHMLRAVLRTTSITAVIVAIYYILTLYFGFSVDDLPSIAP